MTRKTASEHLLMRRMTSMQEVPATFSVQGARWRDSLGTVVRILLGLFIGLAIWEIMSLVMNANGSALGFPNPVQTFERLGQYLFAGKALAGHSIYDHIFASIRRLLVAFGLAAATGIVLGSVLGYFDRIYQMIPGLAWLPVAILLFGLGDWSAIFIIFAVSSMVITIGVSSGIRMVPEVLVNAAKMTGAGRLAIFAKVLVPQASASIVNALRLGMSSAWRVLIAAEMVVGTGVGVGCSIQLTRDLLDYVGSFACITIICLLGLFIDRVLLAGIERWMRSRLGIGES